MKKKDEIKVCLVGSSGGHLTHLYMLKPFWKDKNRFWVTFDKEDARSLLEGEKVYPCYFPTNRSIKALIKNTKIAWDVLHKEKPDLIISCGAAEIGRISSSASCTNKNAIRPDGVFSFELHQECCYVLCRDLHYGQTLCCAVKFLNISSYSAEADHGSASVSPFCSGRKPGSPPAYSRC